RRQATQVGQADLGHQHVHVVFGVVNVADHRHYAGNRAAFGNRLGDEDRQVGVTREVARTTDAVHHLGSTDVGRVDVAADGELLRGVDADDAEAAVDSRVVGARLGTQNQLVLVLLQVAEHALVAALGQGEGAARGEAHLAGVDQVEGR